MQRRKYLAAIGSIAAGGAAVTGTGAFSQSNTERGATIQVANNDLSGAIKLEPGNTNVAYINSEGKLTIDLSRGLRDKGSAGGMNPDSTYYFGADVPNSNLPRLEKINEAEFDEGPLDRPLFTIKNNSSEVRRVAITVTADNLPTGSAVGLFALSSGGNTAGTVGPLDSDGESGTANRFNIDPGQVVTVGFIVNSGTAPGNIKISMNIETNALRD
jgi:hypothetical protein